MQMIAGGMGRHAGPARMGGSLAYVTRQAWIVNDSLQYNVLFEQQLDEQRWEACVHACSLHQDVEVFAKGLVLLHAGRRLQHFQHVPRLIRTLTMSCLYIAFSCSVDATLSGSLSHCPAVGQHMSWNLTYLYYFELYPSCLH